MNKGEKPDTHPTPSFPWAQFLGFLGAVLVAYIGYLGIRSQVEIPIHATETAEAKPFPTIEATMTSLATLTVTPIGQVGIRAEDVTPKIEGVDGGIEQALSWWSVVDSGGNSGELNPTAPVASHYCFALAWNTKEYSYHQLIVFQKPTSVTFADGGWYEKICVPSDKMISAEDVGKIQVDWLGKRYGTDNTPWQVIVIK
jgi:hypothetical protein